MSKAAVDLPIREFCIDVVQGSFTPRYTRRSRFICEFDTVERSIEICHRLDIRRRRKKDVTFRIHDAEERARDARKSLTKKIPRRKR